VFPIVAAIGSAGTLCVFFCGRQISSSPGFRCAPPLRRANLSRATAASISIPLARVRRPAAARRAAGPRRAAESRAAAAFDDDDDARGVRSNLETRAAREGPRDRRRADRSIRPSPRSPPSLSNAIRTFKDARKNECIPEDAKRVKEGISWRENLVRRTVRGMNPQIFPGLNDWMSK
jgi:hypothetical protein